MRTVGFVVLASLVGCASDQTSNDPQSIVAGASYTTFDAVQGGCNDSPNGVDCNNYADKGDVYESGGPVHAGLSDGKYYFSVLVPGYQNGGFIDGADGNLSDTTAGATTGDAGSGDAWTNREFSVTGHTVVTYGGTHGTGTSPNGHFIVQLMPYDDTSNNGGVYILAICQVQLAADGVTEIQANSPSQCKYDAFRIAPGGETAVFPIVTGAKYYDANANGQWDASEPFIAGWPINYTDQVAGTVTTDSTGFTLTLIADSYTFWESQATNTGVAQNGSTLHLWQQTGNKVDQTSVSGGASATLNVDKTYAITVVDNSRVDGLYFGNLCLGKGGGLTLGFWSNKNGQALVTSADLAFLVTLNLRNGPGANFDPTTYSQLRNWLLSATATNMAYMLSAQLTAMELNVRHGFVSAGALVYAPGASSANAAGFATVGDLMNEANTSLGTYGYTIVANSVRQYQEALKNALDNANNNLTFVQGTPATCPAPTF